MNCNNCKEVFDRFSNECMVCMDAHFQAFNKASIEHAMEIAGKKKKPPFVPSPMKLDALDKMYAESMELLNKDLHSSGTFEGGLVWKNCDTCKKTKDSSLGVCNDCFGYGYRHHQSKAEPIPEPGKPFSHRDIKPVSEAQARAMYDARGVNSEGIELTIKLWKEDGFIIIKEKPTPLDNCPFCGSKASRLKHDKDRCSCINGSCPCRGTTFESSSAL